MSHFGIRIKSVSSHLTDTLYWSACLSGLCVDLFCSFSSMQVPCWTETCELWAKSWQAQHYHTQQFSAGVKSLRLLWSHCFCVWVSEWLNNLPLLLPLCASIHPARPQRLKNGPLASLTLPTKRDERVMYINRAKEWIPTASQPWIKQNVSLLKRKKKVC